MFFSDLFFGDPGNSADKNVRMFHMRDQFSVESGDTLRRSSILRQHVSNPQLNLPPSIVDTLRGSSILSTKTRNSTRELNLLEFQVRAQQEIAIIGIKIRAINAGCKNKASRHSSCERRTVLLIMSFTDNRKHSDSINRIFNQNSDSQNSFRSSSCT